MQISRRNREHNAMVVVWCDIFAEHLPDARMQRVCLRVPQHFIDRMAISCLCTRAPALQFYANMLYLEWLLTPTFAGDEFGQKVVKPAWQHIHGWIEAHRFTRS